MWRKGSTAISKTKRKKTEIKNSSRKTTAIYYDNLYILTFRKNNLLNTRKQVNRFSLAQAYRQKNFLKAGYPPQIKKKHRSENKLPIVDKISLLWLLRNDDIHF